MCGISGFIDFNKKLNSNDNKNISEAIKHRGPDSHGFYFEKFDTFNIGLAHKRLSILDLSSLGHQPMHFNNLILIYNGEIYNFKEIKNELKKLGYNFISNSDTEVIIKAFDKWGKDMVHKFNGMFAFVIFDKRNKKIYLFRDRAGVKPLYWYFKDNVFLFSSELKSFSKVKSFNKKISNKSVNLFLKYGYIPEPLSIFEYSKKLKSGHILSFDLYKNQIDIKQYWNVCDFYNMPKFTWGQDEVLEKLRKLLVSSCEYRMISDVPVGIFLSGGYDSSLVTAVIQKNRAEKVKTFSIGFYENKFNEAKYANEVAKFLGTDHSEYYCSINDALNIVPEIPNIWDEPFADASAIPTLLVSKLAREKVTVSLSADGGDELFGGYSKYEKIIKLNKLLKKINYLHPVFRSTKSLLNNLLPENKSISYSRRINKILELLQSENIINSLRIFSEIFNEDELSQLLLNNSLAKEKTGFDISIDELNDDLSQIDKMLATDYKTYQSDDILTKVDRSTMSVSLEGREPLLDYRLVEFCARLNPKMKKNKSILKKITHEYIPKKLMDRPKMGFSVPISSWLKSDLKESVIDYLNFDYVSKYQILNPKETVRYRDFYLKNNNIRDKQIWNILMFNMWCEKWI